MPQRDSSNYCGKRLVQTIPSARGSRRRGFYWVRHESVAHAASGIDQGRVVPELATESPDVHINVTPREMRTLLTDLSQHLLSIENPSRLAH